PNPTANNLLGRVYQHRDAAGVATMEHYDFKGNLLESTRQLLEDYVGLVDWNGSPPPRGTVSPRPPHHPPHRPNTSTAPDGSVIFPAYNEARLLKGVEVQLPTAQSARPYVSDLRYDAKGQRTLIVYGNGAQTTYEYDRYTFRLIHLKTTRPAGDTL